MTLLKVGAWPSGTMLRQYLSRVIFAGLLAAAALVVATKGGAFPAPLALLDAFLFAALAALVTTFILFALKLDFTNAYLDLVWRVVTTGVQAFAGALGASAVQSVLHFPWALTWHVVVGAMVLSFLKNAPAVLNPHAVGADPLIPKVHALDFTDAVGGGGGGSYVAGFGEGLDTELRRRRE